VSTKPLLAEQLPPLKAQEALVEANRCLYCFDAPCTHACPTHIDIPRFIKKITTANLTGSARTILDSNLMGATCARVCPVEELCEGACVLNSEHNPIMIGRLQRHAMDHVYDNGINVLQVAPPTGHRIAVIGAGPAGLSCAGELARCGHEVDIFEKRDLAGGLSTYGIIVLREPIRVALAEVEMIKRLGVKFITGVDVDSPDLLTQYEAVFVATGLGSTPTLGIPGEEFIHDGLAFIERSKMDPAGLRVGGNVVVVGAGNTAIDCATVARRSGASRVTMVYRRTEREMSAYAHEYEFVKKEGVEFAFLTQPVAVHANSLECIRMGDGLVPVPNSNFMMSADMVIKAIGQQKPAIASIFGLETNRGYIKVDGSLETSVPGIYAGGDCIRAKGSASTVMATQDGKIAAASIHGRCGYQPRSGDAATSRVL
jgi:dihydropyrimidine dehydrogenase (NAD+) subunit PreT